MTPKELLKYYKAAPWKNTDEAKAFIGEIDFQPDGKTVAGMLEMLCSKRLSGNLASHDMRLQIFTKLAPACEDKSLFAHYVQAIKNGDSRVRATVVPLMTKVNNYQEHAKLCALLKSADSPTRSAASEAIKKVAVAATAQTLGKLLGEKDFKGRSEAMDLLVPMAGHHAVPALRSVLEVGTSKEKIKALEYLGHQTYMAKAPSVALRAILPALEDRNDQVIVHGIQSFSKLAGEEAFFEYIEGLFDVENLAIVRAAVMGLSSYCSPKVISILERKLRAGPSVIRKEVLATLERIGKDEVLPPLVEALGHRQQSVRNQAVEVLSKLSQTGKIDVARVIIWLLHSSNVDVRRMAVEVARKVPDPEAKLWPKLLGFLRDEDWWVRERVKDALVEMAGKQLTTHMVAYLGDPYDVVRRFAVDVLIRIGDPQALGALVKTAREDDDWWTREKAVEAMAELKDQRAIPYIIDLMRKEQEVRLVCIDALKDLEAKDAAPYVCEQLKDPDVDVKKAALKCLEAFGSTEFEGKVQPLLAEPDPLVARAARELLLHWNVSLSTQYTATSDKATSFLDKMLLTVVSSEADDLILASDRTPYMKRLGKTVPISETQLTHDQIKALLTPHLTLTQFEALTAMKDVDFSYEVRSDGSRFRVNVFRTYSGLAAVFRVIKGKLPELDQLGLPPIVKSFGDLKYGLVLVGGPTGSGKSTTLAALIDYINRTSDRHVISLEDPIEVVHDSKKGLVNQREVGTHAQSFREALRSTLREDPDVILVGEMRDLPTIDFAVTAAETGHLVFGTLHTVSADTSIDRLLNAYPSKEQSQVRVTLAENLKAVLCQYLIRRKDKKGRVLATEIMLNNDAIANLIRKGKTYQIPSTIATGSEQGMQLMDNQLMHLYRVGSISAEEAYMKANSKKEFEELVSDGTENIPVLNDDPSSTSKDPRLSQEPKKGRG